MTKKLIMTLGLPGSGKSTWAQEEKLRLEKLNIKAEIICKDTLRKQHTLTGWKWSHEGEKEIIRMRDTHIDTAFAYGTDVVIIADTNFGKHEARLRQIAKIHGAQFEIKDFTKVDVAECIARDAARAEDDRVGPEVIKNMYNKYLAVAEEPAAPNKPNIYKPDWSRPYAIICDLDGTVALHDNKRSPYDYAKVGQDRLNEPVADIVKLYAASGHAILYVSGRESWCREQTESWLNVNGLPWGGRHKLIMRAASDHRKDFIVKEELFDAHIRKEYNVKFVLDDRTQVVKMWRGLGLTCLQVAEGNF